MITAEIGQPLRETVKTETGTPDHLALYAMDVHGPGAVVRAVGALRKGRRVAFAICTRDGANAPTVKNILALAPIKGRAVVRRCGQDLTALGPESWTVRGCGSLDRRGEVTDLPETDMVAYIIAALYEVGRCFFLIEDDGPTKQRRRGGVQAEQNNP
jgi:hypothetical protein